MFRKLDTSWETWQKALPKIKNIIPNPVSFNTWIAPLNLLGLEENPGEEPRLYFQVPSEFYVPMMQNYMMNIRQGLEAADGRLYALTFLSEEDLDSLPPEGEEAAIDSSNLLFSPKNTFDTFVVGASNQLAAAAALAVAEAPGKTLNPLFIYGGTGMGKTHLLQAIGNFMMAGRVPGQPMRIVYVSCEKFINDFISSISTINKWSEGAKEKFRTMYRGADVLMIDDIQILAGKKETQDEMFNIFNELHQGQKQIVFSSDRPPLEIQNLDERLKNRFSMGFTADIQPPDLETRIAILTKKMDLRRQENPSQPPLDEEVTEYIASHCDRSIRELEGALNQVCEYARLNRCDITLDMTRLALKDRLNNSRKKATPENIMRMVCDRYGITEEDFLSRTKRKEIAQPRKIAMYLSREITGSTYEEIGRLYGGRDHTTVLSAWRDISAMYTRDQDLRKLVADIRQQLDHT